MTSSPPSADLGFIHRFLPGAAGHAPLLLLHGTGGNEDDLIPLARRISPGSALLSPRGKVLEMGMPRYFRRRSEGVFDLDDMMERTDELADFVLRAQDAYGIGRPVAMGFSNGANIAYSLLFRHPELLAGAILFRAVLPFEPETLPALDIPVLLTLGSDDPMISPQQAARLGAALTRTGARLTERTLPAGHGLTPDDIALAETWMKERSGEFGS
ncbi:MAG TPA: alpha/beta hydrolase [Xanthobacteraceae bacterium]|nr:alpha/beta hydrolase [Xanthobacteraceae bacterium]